ncbi:uncharacterized protein K460DRAFT_177969 [Cucurbitaria berberidis CBS 394.84]|uniref:Uncharacterized protein n=1 Tax=Cucurbitaria berberidis CBS 394.84 TaxID=1168544 RepID=A0A9P4GAN2_9PLEO|nr:uncharacterized protein K460DRAFT_177969 [Cucurbitaria berberidis CBS 394.84]KAF1842039.1 hypothetical protein K460DRAFT_177969 [Cucurbitaria berberidis CBS 394.84]
MKTESTSRQCTPSPDIKIEPVHTPKISRTHYVVIKQEPESTPKISTTDHVVIKQEPLRTPKAYRPQFPHNILNSVDKTPKTSSQLQSRKPTQIPAQRTYSSQAPTKDWVRCEDFDEHVRLGVTPLFSRTGEAGVPNGVDVELSEGEQQDVGRCLRSSRLQAQERGKMSKGMKWLRERQLRQR